MLVLGLLVGAAAFSPAAVSPRASVRLSATAPAVVLTRARGDNDGLRALSGGEDGRLRVWRVEDDVTKAGTL